MVEIYDVRVDIVSPGGVCKGITRENFGTISITRNYIIASMLYRNGYIEQMGTGIMRMKNAAREAEVAEPEFKLSGFFKVTFKRKSTSSSDSQAVASGSQAVAATDRKREIMVFIEAAGQASSTDVAEKLGLTSGRVRAILREMVSDGTIEKIGDNRYAYYKLKK